MISRLFLCLVILLAWCGVGCSTAAKAPSRQAGSIGTSRQGRPLPVMMFGHGPRRIYLIAGIHGDEPEGLSGLRDLRIELSQHRHAANVTVRLLEDMNPDGTAVGTRFSSSRVDLNRAWPASNVTRALPEQPEVTAALKDMEQFSPNLIIVLHSARSGPFVNFDGPARAFADAFVDGANTRLKASGSSPRWRVQPDMGYPTPGSMGSFWGKDRNIPILTIEFARGAQIHEVEPALVGGIQAVLSSP